MLYLPCVRIRSHHVAPFINSSNHCPDCSREIEHRELAVPQKESMNLFVRGVNPSDDISMDIDVVGQRVD